MRLLQKFSSARRGSIGILGAMMIGVTSAVSCAAIEFHLATEAKRNVQRALDEATLTAARAVKPASDAKTTSASDENRVQGKDFNDTGEAIFKSLLINKQVTPLTTSFKLEDASIVDAVATAEYKTMFARVIGMDTIELRAEARARTADSPAPACLATWVNGVVVEGGSSIDAAACGVASAGEITVNGTSTTKLDCANGECPVDDAIAGPLNDWVTGTGAMLSCSGATGVGWTEQTFSGTIKFCDEIIVDDGQTIHLLGGDFYFVKGLTVRSGGRVDSTGGGGSAIILGQYAMLNVEPGATFAIAPYASGIFPGIALALDSVGFVSNFAMSSTAPGGLFLSGLIYAPTADITLRGPGAISTGTDGLAIWGESLSLQNGIALPGMPTTLGAPLPNVSPGGGSGEARLIR